MHLQTRSAEVENRRLEILPFLHRHEDSRFSAHLGVREIHRVSVQVLSNARSITGGSNARLSLLFRAGGLLSARTQSHREYGPLCICVSASRLRQDVEPQCGRSV
jgi:hypothetical protein